MIFYKTSAWGNDFLHLDGGEADTSGHDRAELAVRICRPHHGIGADGVVFFHSAPWGGVEFRIYNNDGGEAELSGNGMAGLAAVLFHNGAEGGRVTLDTRVGPRTVRLLGRRGRTFSLEVEIGPPDFAAARFFPFITGSGPYEAAGFRFHPVAVGNPHAVVVLEAWAEGFDWAEAGAEMQRSPLFPCGVNVEFVAPAAEGAFRVRFVERGVGPTLASSTGSAAVFAVLRRLGLCPDRAVLDTGADRISVSGASSIFIANHTDLLCRGEYFI